MEFSSDLTSHFGPTRDQGQRPTCLAFAGSDLNRHHHCLNTHLSAEDLYFGAVQVMPHKDPTRGINLSAISSRLRSTGQPIENDWPYLPMLPSDLGKWMPPETLGELFQANLQVGRDSVEEIFAAIEGGRSVLLGLVLTEQFFRPNDQACIDSNRFDHSTPHRHAVIGVATGHDEHGTPYLLVRNSWGGEWGLDGHSWISKSYLSNQLIFSALIERLDTR